MIHGIKVTFLHNTDSLFIRTNQIFHNKKILFTQLFKIPHLYSKIKRELQ